MVTGDGEEPAAGEVTLLLEQARAGDQDAYEQLLPLVYGHLRALAGSYMRGQKPGHTLQPTALVHEAYIRLAGSDSARRARNRAHFMAIAARAMRQILVDHARRKATAKRGGELDRVTLDDAVGVAGRKQSPAVDVLDLDRALARLSQLHERQGQVLELRFFAGMTIKETARALGVSTDTVEDDFAVARVWLRRELRGT